MAPLRRAARIPKDRYTKNQTVNVCLSVILATPVLKEIHEDYNLPSVQYQGCHGYLSHIYCRNWSIPFAIPSTILY